MMGELVATVSVEGSEKWKDLAVQLSLLGTVAITLGALRLYLARRALARLLLVLGTVLYTLSVFVGVLQIYGKLELKYYPGWKEDISDPVEVLGLDPGDPFLDPTPAWWEGVVWWGEIVLSLGGLALGAAGFVGMARQMADEAPRRTGRAT